MEERDTAAPPSRRGKNCKGCSTVRTTDTPLSDLCSLCSHGRLAERIPLFIFSGLDKVQIKGIVRPNGHDDQPLLSIIPK